VIEQGRQAMGAGPAPYTPPERPQGRLNTTDPDARRMKQGRAFLPAYNAQAVTTEGQIVVAAELTTAGADFQQLEPMFAAAERELERAGVRDGPKVVLADAGYWSNGHIDALRERGIVPLVAPDTTRNKPRKTRLGGPYDFMRRVLASERGGALYSQRQWMVEPVFAQIKSNRRIDRFKRRGFAAARSEWRLIAATHNLLKLHRHSLRAAGPKEEAPAHAAPARAAADRARFVRQPHARVSHKPLLGLLFCLGWRGRFGRSRAVRCAVAQNLLPCDRDQELLLPPSLREWLPEDHLAWLVLEAGRAA
jgi:hypothetical protein